MRLISKNSLMHRTKQKLGSPLSKGHFAVKCIRPAKQTGVSGDTGSSVIHLPSDPPPQRSTSPAHPEDSVEGEFAQFRSHGGLGQLGHCVLRIFHTITGLEGREAKNQRRWQCQEGPQMRQHRQTVLRRETCHRHPAKQKRSPEPWEGPGAQPSCLAGCSKPGRG